ncbi:DoxX family protein [Sneathiella limimaris]|uniref:DoxX family protein n=1 Tax=Sneathiella limimaris TaxID=1964213 RepID=UPI00146E174D|nr:DoxX family protein [Sneathiella limimaris]
MSEQTDMTTASVNDGRGLKGLINRLFGYAEAIPDSALSVVARIGIAGIFFRSGQTKVDGFTVTDSTLYLFEDEYALPLLDPVFAAHLASIAEHLFPVLLIIGLASRFSAAALLFMTLVIQIFVYPGSWPDHFTWAAVLLFIMARGPGVFSIDHLIRKSFGS